MRLELGVLLLALVCGCASTGPKVEEIRPPEHEEKSVSWGVFLATVPGFFYHGMGSRYAGDERGAEELWGQEAVSLYFVGSIALGLGLEAIWDAFIKDEVNEDTRDIVDDVFMWQAYTTGPITYTLGGYLFLSSWLNDILRTPRLVEEWNRRRALRWSPRKTPRSPRPNGS